MEKCALLPVAEQAELDLRLNANSRHCFGAVGRERSRIALSFAFSPSDSPCAPSQCFSSRKAAASAGGCGPPASKGVNLPSN